ncbi:MAG: type II secretion system protein [Armatimonadota bacterium]
MKWDCYRRRHISRGFGSLIEILIVAVIILCGAALYMGMMRGTTSATNAINNNDLGGPASAGGPQSIPARTIQKAHSMECQNNVRQLRQLIEMSKSDSENGTIYPSSLSNMPEAAKISKCPVGREPYQYDPTTGKIHCVHPGHEGF